ncbi:MAG: hypothetical protein AB7I27_14880 [Bacteriovoracaceae bacterium]
MKLLLLILLPFSAYAIDFGLVVSSGKLSSSQIFKLKSQSFHYIKKSNYFDNIQDLRLGTFTAASDKSIFFELSSIYQATTKADRILRDNNSSFNALNGKVTHQPFFILDDFRISSESNLYPKLHALFQRLIKLNWSQVSGISLKQDLKHYSIFEKSKEVAIKDFSLAFHCERRSPPTYCKFKDEGVLFIKDDLH